MKITVVGLGYVGASIAVLLAQKNEVVALDVDQVRVEYINKRLSPVHDDYLQTYLKNNNLNLKATVNKEEAYKGSDFIVVAVPTNYDPVRDYFDTNIMDMVIEDAINFNSNAAIIIKSTVPVGYTRQLMKKFGGRKIIFSPEFLREGRALYDNLYPSRIVVGSQCEVGEVFAKLLLDGALNPKAPILLINSDEAEASKLFANAYLAMRVAYFNELDTYAAIHKLDTKNIVEAISLDPRIGMHYNNPSFGYGGYCLPKDTKQLLSNFRDVPQDLIGAIVKSNETRINFIARDILQKNPDVLGVYRMVMKSESDNLRESSIHKVIEIIKSSKVRVVIYEPILKVAIFEGCEVISDLQNFKEVSNLIVANRLTDELVDVQNKIYTRDLFSVD